jgi:hypothetical protein
MPDKGVRAGGALTLPLVLKCVYRQMYSADLLLQAVSDFICCQVQVHCAYAMHYICHPSAIPLHISAINQCRTLILTGAHARVGN